MKPNSDISQELSELSPLLGNLRSEVAAPLAPEGFLEEHLPGAVWQKIDAATGTTGYNNRPKVIHLILGMAAAAAVLLAVSLTVRFTVDSESALPPPAIYASNDITRNDIIHYLIDNVVELEAAEIMSRLEIVQEQPVLPDDDFAAVNDWLEEHVDVLDMDILTEELL